MKTYIFVLVVDSGGDAIDGDSEGGGHGEAKMAEVGVEMAEVEVWQR